LLQEQQNRLKHKFLGDFTALQTSESATEIAAEYTQRRLTIEQRQLANRLKLSDELEHAVRTAEHRRIKEDWNSVKLNNAN